MPNRWWWPLSASIFLMFAGCDRFDPAPETAKPKRQRPDHPVEVLQLALAPSRSSLERTGSLRTRRLVRIYNQEEGRIVELPVYEGDRVAAGDLLVSLDDALLRAERAKAKATAHQAQVDLRRISDLAQRQVASQDELARARTAVDVAQAEQQLLETRLGYTRIEAPFTGLISARHFEPGDVVPRHTHILTLSDPSSLVTELPVSELLLAHLALGDVAEVRIDALGKQTFQGRILRIHPDIDPATRMGIVEVVLEPVPEGARAGQFARVTLRSAETERLLIPFSALQRDRNEEFVYRFDPEQRKTLRQPLRSGIRIADRVEILDGLEPGDWIVTKGFLGLQPGKQVNPVNLPAAGRHE